MQQIKLEAHALQSSGGSKCKSDKPRHRSAHWRKTNSFNSRPVRRGRQFGQGFDAKYIYSAMVKVRDYVRVHPGYLLVYIYCIVVPDSRVPEYTCMKNTVPPECACVCEYTSTVEHQYTCILTRPGCGQPSFTPKDTNTGPAPCFGH